MAAMLGLFAEWGCDTRGAADEAEALHYIAAGFRPEAVVAELRLPGGRCGIDAVAALRTVLWPQLPALIVTADVGSERAAQARAMGLPVPHKPAKAIALRAFLGEAFGHGAERSPP